MRNTLHFDVMLHRVPFGHTAHMVFMIGGTIAQKTKDVDLERLQVFGQLDNVLYKLNSAKRCAATLRKAFKMLRKWCWSIIVYSTYPQLLNLDASHAIKPHR